MKSLSELNIELKGMEADRMEYDFHLDDSYFSLLADSEVPSGDLNVHLVVLKSAFGFELTIDIYGNVIVQCDRCLDDMTQPVATSTQLMVKLGDSFQDDGDDVVTVPFSEGFINIAWIIYETTMLDVPMQHFHPDGECNEEMIKILKSHQSCEIDEDDEHKKEEGNKLFEGLDNLLNNN